MSENRAKVIAAAISARAALDSLLMELMDEVPAPAQEEPPAPVVAAVPCQHEHRTPLKSFGSVEHWTCDDCGHEYRR